MDYKELKDKADAMRHATQARARENYRYARSLGFNSVEATLLQFKSTEEIDQIAKDRDNGGS